MLILREKEAMVNNQDDKMLREVESIKKLLLLLLVKLGADSDEIAMALGVDSSGVRKMISMRKVEKLRLGESD
ncbi:MAG: hypothetical protein DME76_17250 [Verrucomicrobia bacterium]|nr:MAG: hypothetical protein DME76_17250 [Verrucomicrobiota bacterium]